MVHPVVRVALVGYGYAGRTFHAPLIAATPGIELAAIVSRSPAKVHTDLPAARVFEGLDQALADPDIDLVVIATPDPLHAPQAHAALDANKHVVIDKPFALTLEDARSVAEHSRQANRLLSVFHNRRWDSDFLTLRSLIASGRLGEIMQFESHFDRFRPELRDRWRERPGAGIFNDLGPHLIDQALLLFGMPAAVFADLGIQKYGGLADDYFHILLRYPRLRVVLHASQLTLDNSLRLAVHGTSGSFIKRGMDPQEQQLKAGGNPSDPPNLAWTGNQARFLKWRNVNRAECPSHQFRETIDNSMQQSETQSRWEGLVLSQLRRPSMSCRSWRRRSRAIVADTKFLSRKMMKVPAIERKLRLVIAPSLHRVFRPLCGDPVPGPSPISAALPARWASCRCSVSDSLLHDQVRFRTNSARSTSPLMPSYLQSISCASPVSRIDLISVPRRSVCPAPLTSRSLINVT